MRSPEHIRPAEFAATALEHSRAAAHALSSAEAMRIADERDRALAAIGREIATPFREAIQHKIAYERAKLCEIAETEAKRAREHERLQRRLRTEYFSLQRLEIELL